MTTFNLSNDVRNFGLALIASAAMLSFLAAPVKAASETLTYASVELASKGGRAAVDARVEAAAERVCAAGGIDWRQLTETQAYKACVKSSISGAQASLASARTATQVAAR